MGNLIARQRQLIIGSGAIRRRRNDNQPTTTEQAKMATATPRRSDSNKRDFSSLLSHSTDATMLTVDDDCDNDRNDDCDNGNSRYGHSSNIATTIAEELGDAIVGGGSGSSGIIGREPLLSLSSSSSFRFRHRHKRRRR